MRVIVIGGGTVGVEIGHKLSEKGHDVVIIEKNPKKSENIAKNIDAMLIEGNGVSFKILEEAGINEAKIVIAVTEIDEVNIIACMLAKRCGVDKTVARIRNDEYVDGTQLFTHDQLGIDIVINPERIAAMEMAKFIKTPNVKGIDYFAEGKIRMIGIEVEEKSPIANQQVKNITFPFDSNIVAIIRENEDIIIPGGDDYIYPGNEIYLLGDINVLSGLSSLTRHPDKKPDNILIIGGGRIGLQLCKILEQNKKETFQVKLVEQDEERCEELTRELNRTLILHGDGTDLKFLQEEDLDEVDVMVAITGDDKTNLLSSVLCHRLGVDKTIVEIIKSDYELVLSTLKIDSAISPRLLTAAQILKLTTKSQVVSMKILKNDRAEILELNVPDTAPIIGKKLKNAKLPKGLIIGAIVRNGEIITPGGKDEILPRDRVIVFATKECTQKVEKIFAAS